jgi:hypothetical protein
MKRRVLIQDRRGVWRLSKIAWTNVAWWTWIYSDRHSVTSTNLLFRAGYGPNISTSHNRQLSNWMVPLDISTSMLHPQSSIVIPSRSCGMFYVSPKLCITKTDGNSLLIWIQMPFHPKTHFKIWKKKNPKKYFALIDVCICKVWRKLDSYVLCIKKRKCNCRFSWNDLWAT